MTCLGKELRMVGEEGILAYFMFESEHCFFFLFLHQQIYWVGPIAGGAAAGLIYDFLLASNSSVQKVRDSLCSMEFNDEKYPARKPKVVNVEEHFEARAI